MRKNIAATLAMFLGMTKGGAHNVFGTRNCISTEKFERPCLNCRTPHKHNNSFCSASCCKEWREKKRGK
jgi:hypothetical protein